MLNHLDLFSGIGGFSLGLEATGGFKTVGFCEIEPFCQQVLKKHWPDVPIYNDVRGLEHDGRIDIITGGYPCQPFSTAGKRKGQSDPRHLWPAMFGIIEAKRPRWVIGENVAGHISMGLDEVLADLERGAYSAIPFIIPACAVGAPHRRDRIWIVAWDTESQRTPPQCGVSGGQDANAMRICGNVPDTKRDGQHDPAKRISFAGCTDQGRMPEPERPCGAPADVSHTKKLHGDGRDHHGRISAQPESFSELGNSGWQGVFPNAAGSRQPRPWQYEQRGSDSQEEERQADNAFPECFRQFWATEPAVGRVVNGLSERLDAGGQSAAEPKEKKGKAAMRQHRLKSLGNSVVPQIPFMLGKYILEVEKNLLTNSL